MLTDERVATMIHYVRHPGLEFGIYAPPIPLLEIRQVNSETDPRVQLADLVAGVGKVAATRALVDNSAEAASLIRPFANANTLWADERSYRQSTGRTGLSAQQHRSSGQNALSTRRDNPSQSFDQLKNPENTIARRRDGVLLQDRLNTIPFRGAHFVAASGPFRTGQIDPSTRPDLKESGMVGKAESTTSHFSKVVLSRVSEGGLEPDGSTLRIASFGVLSVKSGSVGSRYSLLNRAMCSLRVHRS